MSEFYIVSIKHTRRDSAYITVWRADDCGYAWPLSWAGRYSVDSVQSIPDYYHNGHSTVVVPCATLDEVAVAPKSGAIDGDAGPVVLNTKENWKRILAAMPWQPKDKPRPQYKGARRQKDSA